MARLARAAPQVASRAVLAPTRDNRLAPLAAPAGGLCVGGRYRKTVSPAREKRADLAWLVGLIGRGVCGRYLCGLTLAAAAAGAAVLYAPQPTDVGGRACERCASSSGRQVSRAVSVPALHTSHNS